MAGNQQSKDKYLKESVETIPLRVPLGRKQLISDFAKQNGYRSLNAFINAAICEAMDKGLSKEIAYIGGDNNGVQAINSDNISVSQLDELDEMTTELLKSFRQLNFADKMEIMNAVLANTKK